AGFPPPWDSCRRCWGWESCTRPKPSRARPRRRRHRAPSTFCSPKCSSARGAGPSCDGWPAAPSPPDARTIGSPGGRALSHRERRRVAERADVCLILEGTYPYVTGGVSAWIHQLLRALPEIRFALFHIGSTAGTTPTPQYELPSNAVSLTNLGLHGGDEPDVR